ncbi:uncharacterized protein PAC_13908 [Phialocephala subalpina]|uniref:MYND-type domain-containing protein n=1 Tax=Phialocephala subalpina TaxID=576137 RepID=A0A1L7XG46_9HELO|nr:uncharacterized protein PAC_13908 [Phialocephala subalpina]
MAETRLPLRSHPKIEDTKHPLQIELAKLRCIVCNLKVTRTKHVKCQSCAYAYYCSEEHMKEDLSIHNMTCKQFATLIDSNLNLSPKYKLVIVLPEGGGIPYFHWVTFKSGRSHRVPNLEDLSDPFYMSKQYNITQVLRKVNASTRFGARFTTIDHEVVMHNLRHTIRESYPSATIDALMNYRAPNYWRGCQVIVSEFDFGTKIQNATHHDLRLAIAFLHTYDCSLMRQPRNEPYDLEFTKRGLYTRTDYHKVLNEGKSTAKVKAVIIHSLGDRRMFGQDHFKAVEISRDHPAFQVNCTKISAAMSLPIVTFTLPAHADWRKHHKGTILYNPYENESATNMHLDISAVDDSWGSVNAREWCGKVGSILVVRKNGEDITAQQVEALAEFCNMAVQPRVKVHLKMEREWKERKGVGTAWELTRVHKRRARQNVIEKVLCQKAFDPFFDHLKRQKIKDGYLDWIPAVSPYLG